MKKLTILILIGLSLCMSHQLLIARHVVYAEGNKETTTPTTPDSIQQPETNSKEIFERLYKEGYELGQVDGYNNKKYESFSNDSIVNQSSQESQWLMLGYTVGYEKGKGQKQEEILAQQEKERTAGEQEGYKKGIEDYKQASISSKPLQTPVKSTEWNKGFAHGYKQAVEIMDLAIKAKEDGYNQGLELDMLNIPDLYSADEITRKAYEEGFDIGQNKRTQKLKAKYEKEGFHQGYALQDMFTPQGLAPELAEAFKKGFIKGENQKEKDTYKQGFNFAFTSLKYKEPANDQVDTRLIQWFKEGYQSNKVASPLRKEAYRSGWSIGNKMDLPTKYKENKAAVDMYKKYYKLGQQKQKKTAFEISTILLVIISVVGIYTLFRRNKDINQGSNIEIYGIEKTAK
ncbi:hypothetical protein [Priestia flexa]|uniref:Uncharacterized protein n=1 Tax=Priestia flexa TaxID=86664 RepID=A0A8I1MI87_9BACI|nr:hypothetical protein [Priestia flexa]MBN8253620.1 hypothetical protein [Priestia flexa]MBY6087854.1 hypothetical protein [Priestia flexa]